MSHDSTQERTYPETSFSDRDYVTEGEVIDQENGASSEELRAEIERTRNQMSRKIDTIQNKLSPETIKAQAQDTLRSAMEDGTDAVMSYWRDNQTQIRQSVVGIVKNNPVPTALISVGIGWALIDSYVNRNKPRSGAQYNWDDYRYGAGQAYGQPYGASYQSGQYPGSQEYPSGQPYGSSGEYASAAAGYGESGVWQGEGQGWREGQTANQGSSLGDKIGQAVDQVRETASHLAEKVTNKASDIADQAQHKSQQYSGQMGQLGAQAQQRTQQVVQTNPLAVGGAALALGALIGLLLPSTERENEMMGDLRTQVKDRAQSAMGEVKQRVQHAVEEVKPEMQNLANRVVDDLKGGGHYTEPDRTGASSDQGAASDENMAATATSMADNDAQAAAGRKAKKAKDRADSTTVWDEQEEADRPSSRL